MRKPTIIGFIPKKAVPKKNNKTTDTATVDKDKETGTENKTEEQTENRTEE